MKQNSSNQSPPEGVEEPISAEAAEEVAEEEQPEAEAIDGEVVDPDSPEAKLADAEAKVAEYLDGWQRSRAELENYKKRVIRDRENWRADILGEVISKVLLAYDDLDLAMTNLPKKLEKEDWVTGMQKVHKKFQNQLDDLGLAEIAGPGEPFDPNVHEAVMRAQSDEHETGTVIEVLRKGYEVEGRVIRPALVKVAD